MERVIVIQTEVVEGKPKKAVLKLDDNVLEFLKSGLSWAKYDTIGSYSSNDRNGFANVFIGFCDKDMPLGVTSLGRVIGLNITDKISERVSLGYGRKDINVTMCYNRSNRFFNTRIKAKDLYAVT
jgi:hypothetical protein